MTMTTSRAQFDVSLPEIIPKKYWANTNQGLSYAMYSLVHMGRDDTSDLLQAIRFHTEAYAPGLNLKVIRAPIYDFCSNNKTLKDIYDYHTSILDGGNHDIAPARFIVVAHQDWENQGVLLIDFDCDPTQKGTAGVARTDVAVLPQVLAMLERSNVSHSDVKASELDTKWSEPMPGYTGSEWQRRGYSMYKETQHPHHLG